MNPAGSPTPEELADWKERNRLSVAECALLIHTTPRVIYHYLAGERRMPVAKWHLARMRTNE